LPIVIAFVINLRTCAKPFGLNAKHAVHKQSLCGHHATKEIQHHARRHQPPQTRSRFPRPLRERPRRRRRPRDARDAGVLDVTSQSYQIQIGTIVGAAGELLTVIDAGAGAIQIGDEHAGSRRRAT
jgi:hypothetical protein